MLRSLKLLLAALCGAAVLPAASHAQVAPAPAPKISLVDRLVAELRCQPGQKCDPATATMRTRSIGGKGAVRRPDPRTESGRRSLELDAKTRSLPTADVEVYFPFNSAELVPETRRTLDEMAQALKRAELATSDFALVGHTDAKGTDDYNQSLSERRANAVRQYLATAGRIEDDRLSSWGRGKSELKKPSDPFSGENRRVQLINVGVKSGTITPPPAPMPDPVTTPAPMSSNTTLPPPDAVGTSENRVPAATPTSSTPPVPPQAKPKAESNEPCRQFSPLANTTLDCGPN